MDDDFGLTLNCFCLLLTLRNLGVCGVFDSFHSFLRKYEERKTHNVLSSMLNSQVKSFDLVFWFVDNEQGISIVEKYKKNMYILCFWIVIITYILWKIVKLDL